MWRSSGKEFFFLFLLFWRKGWMYIFGIDFLSSLQSNVCTQTSFTFILIVHIHDMCLSNINSTFKCRWYLNILFNWTWICEHIERSIEIYRNKSNQVERTKKKWEKNPNILAEVVLNRWVPWLVFSGDGDSRFLPEKHWSFDNGVCL